MQIVLGLRETGPKRLHTDKRYGFPAGAKRSEGTAYVKVLQSALGASVLRR